MSLEKAVATLQEEGWKGIYGLRAFKKPVWAVRRSVAMKADYNDSRELTWDGLDRS